MAAIQQEIKDAGSLGKYFAMMLHIDDDDLDPFEYKLLGHYRKVCGLSSTHTCFEATSTTAKNAKMSEAKVRDARRSLETMGRIKTSGSDGRSISVTVCDCMDENLKRYLNPLQKREGSQKDNPSRIREISPDGSIRAGLTNPSDDQEEEKDKNLNALSSPSAQTPEQPEKSWYAINHKTKQIIIPGQTHALLSVDMSMLSEDWFPVLLPDMEGEYKGYARLSLSAVLESPNPSSAPPLPPQQSTLEPAIPTPLNTRWIHPLDSSVCHLVRDANQPTTTLCGIKPLPSYMAATDVLQVQACPKCLKATEKKPKPDKPKHIREPQPTDVLFDAVALYLFSAQDKASQHAVAGRVGQIMYGDKKSGRCHGLIAYEKERKGIEALDYGALAKDVERFWKWFKQDHPELDLKDCAKVMEWWVKWRAAPMQTSDLVDDPDRPGVRITQAQLRTRLEEKRVMEQIYGK